MDDNQASRIAIYREGSIESSDGELKEIRKWHVEQFLKLKEVFGPELREIATYE